MFDATLVPAGFALSEARDLFTSADLNNRAETRQRIYVLDRRA